MASGCDSFVEHTDVEGAAVMVAELSPVGSPREAIIVLHCGMIHLAGIFGVVIGDRPDFLRSRISRRMVCE